MPSLILEEDGKQNEIKLSEGITLIGRHPDSTVQIANATVSGKHAQIVVDGGNGMLEDMGSRNGTFVNEQQIKQQIKLKHGDRIEFGKATARYIESPKAASLTDAEAAPATLVSPTPGAGLLAAVLPVAGETSAQIGATVNFSVDAEDDEVTITSALSSQGRFGALDANPEAKLKAVLDISSSLAGTVDLNSLLPKILDSLFDIFKYADRGCILLKDENSENMVPRAFKHRRAGEDATVRLSRTIVAKVLKDKAGILSADASADAQFDVSESISELKIRSMMCVPMLGLNGEPVGILSIDSQNPLGQFTNDDLELLMVVAGQASLSYENARLLQSYAAKQKQDGELQIAKDIQRALLPNELPILSGYEFYASYDSAQAVGGDYYDCFVLSDGRIALSFGDVAGKGVPGALIMSRMSSCVQSTLHHVQEVEPAMHAINNHMCDSAVEGRFVTYVLCIIDTIRHEVQLSNAGHMSPVIRKADGSIEQFDNDEMVGPPIGVVDDYPYEVETRTLDPGDIVVIVTDGVDEAMNPQDEFYGVERTIEFIKNGPAKADELGGALLADVRRHANGRPQNDDITIMTFGRNPD
ncbi:MAG: SpoIIE family protein phosphatase [Planctomycetes bacterium]|nr:SpoIIE family protein phosphatase [Planctomycetota bacterium]